MKVLAWPRLRLGSLARTASHYFSLDFTIKNIISDDFLGPAEKIGVY